MSDIKTNLAKIQATLPAHVQLIAVSKTHPIELLQEAYAAGARHFGENKVQELGEKQPLMPTDAVWHFIGHLQTNKVKYIAPYIGLVHSVDSIKLCQELNKEAKKHSRTINFLLQFHVAQEETKFGLSLDEAFEILDSPLFSQLENIRPVGVMGMASFTDDMTQVRREFRQLKQLFDELKQRYFSQNDWFKELSMGMSHDYQIAIEEGSTMVRVGSSIFGNRYYQ